MKNMDNTAWEPLWLSFFRIALKSARPFFKSVPVAGRGGIASMRFKTAYAQMTEGNTCDNARAAAGKIGGELAEVDPAFVIFFASTEYDADTIADEMHKAFPGAVTMGCSTSGEACDDKILSNSVVAMAYSREVSAFLETVVVVADPGEANAPDVFSDTPAALEYLGRNLGQPMISLDYREYFGFMLGDNVSEFNERVIERLGEITNAFLVGGIAGDDYKFQDLQYVFYKGKAYRHGAAALALWKPASGFEFLKTQAVEPTDKQFTITKADEKNRIIWELDGQDAAPVFAKAIGVPLETMGMRDFDQNPLALLVNGDPYLRVLVKIVDNKGLVVLSAIREGTKFTLTKIGEVLDTTRQVFAERFAEKGKPAAILHINCAGRHTLLRKADQLDAFAQLFEGVPHIAFSSYSEIYIDIVAMTSIMVLFK
jgi:hypothetical protein